jgi:hypothetical protein
MDQAVRLDVGDVDHQASALTDQRGEDGRAQISQVVALDLWTERPGSPCFDPRWSIADKNEYFAKLPEDFEQYLEVMNVVNTIEVLDNNDLPLFHEYELLENPQEARRQLQPQDTFRSLLAHQRLAMPDINYNMIVTIVQYTLDSQKFTLENVKAMYRD